MSGLLWKQNKGSNDKPCTVHPYISKKYFKSSCHTLSGCFLFIWTLFQVAAEALCLRWAMERLKIRPCEGSLERDSHKPKATPIYLCPVTLGLPFPLWTLRRCSTSWLVSVMLRVETRPGEDNTYLLRVHVHTHTQSVLLSLDSETGALPARIPKNFPSRWNHTDAQEVIFLKFRQGLESSPSSYIPAPPLLQPIYKELFIYDLLFTSIYSREISFHLLPSKTLNNWF